MRKIFSRTFAPLSAQMAESVDALVSNTSGATRAGSTPALGTLNYSESVANQVFATLFIFTASKKRAKSGTVAKRCGYKQKMEAEKLPFCRGTKIRTWDLLLPKQAH